MLTGQFDGSDRDHFFQGMSAPDQRTSDAGVLGRPLPSVASVRRRPCVVRRLLSAGPFFARAHGMPTDLELDTALLACLTQRWMKVASVLGRAAEVPGLGYQPGTEDYDVLALRLGELVASGAVEARGDLNHWRLSEVRLPGIDMDEAERDFRRMTEMLRGGGDGSRRA